ncbi:MAG: tRNA modification GTPase [Pirellulales bacterium]
MPYHLDDTVAAIATAPGGAARGIVRLSGPEVRAVVQRCFTPDDAALLEQCQRPTSTSGRLHLIDLRRELPCQLLLWPGERSYTRQPSAELHTIGSPPLLQAAMRACCHSGARLAEPGEFTLRAFLAGRLDLTQAEAVLGVIDAQGRSELDAALAQLAGGLARPLQDLRGRLLDLLAELEAGLDFVEEDIEFITSERLTEQLGEVNSELAQIAAQLESRGEYSGAARVVLAGMPNVGKSSLFNALVRHEHALVSEQAGTTRDYLVAQIDFDGVACELVDTAGMESAGPEQHAAQLAQQLANARRQEAPVVLWCLDASRPLAAAEREQLARWDQSRLPGQVRLIAWTKADAVAATPSQPAGALTSSRTGAGLDVLRTVIRQAVLEAQSGDASGVAATAARCRESMQLAAAALDRAGDLASLGGGEELVAVELRLALHELGTVAGEVYTDDVLDRIFSRFCIGK